MGTELQYSVNLFTSLPKNNDGDAVGIRFDTSDTWAFSKNRFLKENIWTGFDQLQVSMDILLEECNRESLRNTMLKQEKIFKEQVRELHRLYRVQKILMAELRSKELKLHSLSHTTPGPIEGPSTRFWSGDLDLPAEEDVAIGQSKDRTSTDGESDVELTLSIGCGGNKKRARHRSHSNLESGCSVSTSNDTRQLTLSTTHLRPDPEESGEPSSGFDRKSFQQQPPRLFQALSLNRT